MDPSPFLRTVSYRDFFTSFTLAISSFALSKLLAFSFSALALGNAGGVSALVAITAALANHFWYKVEHGQSNNFVGRVMQDAIYFSFFNGFMILWSFLSMSNQSESIPGPPMLTLVVGFIILGFIFESIVETFWLLYDKTKRAV